MSQTFTVEYTTTYTCDYPQCQSTIKTKGNSHISCDAKANDAGWLYTMNTLKGGIGGEMRHIWLCQVCKKVVAETERTT